MTQYVSDKNMKFKAKGTSELKKEKKKRKQKEENMKKT